MIETAKAGGLIARAVREAVEAFATPTRAAQVVALALRWARRADVPEHGPEAASFVDGPLFLAAEELLGEEAARAIRGELTVMVSQMVPAPRVEEPELIEDAEIIDPVEADYVGEPEEISAIRASWPSLMPGAMRAASEPADEEPRDGLASQTLRPTDLAPRLELPVLMVASSDPTEVQRLALALSGIAYLEPVSDALAVLEGLGGAPVRVVVFDVRRPAIQAETLLAMQPELPAGTRVVVWGERGALRRKLAGLGEGLPDEWIVCGAEASAEDVARICQRLFE